MRLIKVKLLIDYWAGQNLLLVPITVAVMWICNSSGSLIIFFPEHTVCLRSLVKFQLHTYYKNRQIERERDRERQTERHRDRQRETERQTD